MSYFKDNYYTPSHLALWSTRWRGGGWKAAFRWITHAWRRAARRRHGL